MAVLLGEKRSGTIFSHTVEQNEQLREGVTYEAVYPAEGIGTLMPGWETDAINQVTSTLASQGCTPTYFEVAGDLNPFSAHTVTVQFQYTPTGAQAVIAPLVWAVIGLLLVAGIIAWLTLYAPSTIKAISDSLVENPIVMYLGGGIIAILLLQQINNWRSGGGYDDY
jgi:hypothetical protein